MWQVLSGGSTNRHLMAPIMFNTKQLKQDNCNHMTANSHYVFLIEAKGNVKAFKLFRNHVVHILKDKVTPFMTKWILKMKVYISEWVDSFLWGVDEVLDEVFPFHAALHLKILYFLLNFIYLTALVCLKINMLHIKHMKSFEIWCKNS